MKIRTSIKCGLRGITFNHNVTLAPPRAMNAGTVLQIKTGLKAGIYRKPIGNHAETLKGLQIKTGLKAGIYRKPIGNHSETLQRRQSAGRGPISCA